LPPPLLPPLLVPPFDPLVGLGVLPPVGAPPACCPPQQPVVPMRPEVPVIPEADSLLLLGAGLLALGGGHTWRRWKRRR